MLIGFGLKLVELLLLLLSLLSTVTVNAKVET